ncbi:lipase member H-B isoform X3 [Bactrocera oleae]|uniref:lipase member H-B isoform X3 n=1 Tax=Bactrocera oleae TaxID=104688 RepID=UPI00387E626B
MKFSLAFLLTFCFVYKEAPAIIFNQMDIKSVLKSGALDLNVLRCFLHNKNICPSPYIMYRLYAPKSSRHGITLNIHNPLTLFKGDFNPHRETAFIVHGFNGSAVDVHLQFLKDAYLSRDFNVITVDWRPLTRYPCYLHALINTRLTAQCTAQVYSFLTHNGAVREKITCIGHSLGAHICGMISNHLSIKQHRIIGLDPARPLIERKKNHIFKLSIDDANVIQVIHTNAGFLGQEENIGHLNYCVNGGRFQPFCKGNPISGRVHFGCRRSHLTGGPGNKLSQRVRTIWRKLLDEWGSLGIQRGGYCRAKAHRLADRHDDPVARIF